MSEDQNRFHVSMSSFDRGSPGLTWIWRNDQYKDGNRWQVFEKKCPGRSHHTCSTLVVNRAVANDTSYFTCLYSDLPSNKELKAELYIFVRGKWFKIYMKYSLTCLSGYQSLHGCFFLWHERWQAKPLLLNLPG